MATSGEDYLMGDDLDAILDLIEEDIPEENEEFLSEVNAVIDELSEPPPPNGFPCVFCDKVCKSKRGLSRHQNIKHPEENIDNPNVKKKKTAEVILNPVMFQSMINSCAAKLYGDECYSAKIRQEFHDYVVTLDDAKETLEYFRHVIIEFKGNAETFYPKFYKCVSDDIIFKKLTRRSSVLLGCELTNHVLAHLTNSTVKENIVEFETPTYSKKDCSIIKYLSGYVFSTIYRRLRRSKSTQNLLGIQCLDFLLVGKSSLKHNSEFDMFTRAKDRGGLWNVTIEVYEIFCHVETVFRKSTIHVSRSIDSKKIVSDVMGSPSVLCNFNKIRSQCSEKVSKEVGLNLLDHLITLYVRVRTFSLVKDKCELHKIASKRKKTKSLRTEIKKASSSLDQGH